MGLLGWLGFPRRDDLVLEVSESLARQCRESVWEVVRARAGSLSLHEAQGYVRVRSASIVTRHVDRVQNLSPQAARVSRTQLLHLTTNAVIRQLTDRMVRVPSTTRIQQRRAA